MWVDLLYQLVQAHKFTIGNYGKDHRLIVSQISGLCIDQCRSAVKTFLDQTVQFFVFLSHDLYFCSGRSHQQYLVQNDGIDQYQ